MRRRRYAPSLKRLKNTVRYRFTTHLVEVLTRLLKLCNDNPDLIEMLGKKDVDGHSRPLAGQTSALMQEFVDTLTMRVESYHADVGLDFVMAPRLSVQLTIALIVGAAHLGEDFLGEMEDRLLAEMAVFVVYGAPGIPGTAGSAKRIPDPGLGWRQHRQRAALGADDGNPDRRQQRPTAAPEMLFSLAGRRLLRPAPLRPFIEGGRITSMTPPAGRPVPRAHKISFI